MAQDTSFLGALTFIDIGIFLGALLFFGILLLVFSGNSANQRLQKRIKGLEQRKHGTQKTVKEKVEVAYSLRKKQSDDSLPLLNKLITFLPTLSLLKSRLERAGIQATAERYIFICIIVFIVTTLLMTLGVHKPPLIAMFTGIIVAVGLPHLVVGLKARRRLAAFVKIFPDGIDLIVRGLRSGLPVSESIQLVSREVPDPVGSIFATVANTVKLGVSLEGALQDVGKKLNCTEFNFFVTSIVLQKETGGNLSEILNNLSEVLRKRTMMILKIKAMTSEAKASMYIIGALPFAVSTVVHFASPGYLDPLFDTPSGNMCLLAAVTSLCTGVGTMMKMSKFEL